MESQPEVISSMGRGLVVLIVFFIVGVVALVSIIATWRIFKKAGQPGWASLIPVYNLLVMLQMVKKPEWWIILFFFPYVNFVMAALLMVALAKAFGKSAFFGIFFLLIFPIGHFILAFGKSTYVYAKNIPPTPNEQLGPQFNTLKEVPHTA